MDSTNLAFFADDTINLLQAQEQKYFMTSWTNMFKPYLLGLAKGLHYCWYKNGHQSSFT